MATEQTDLLCKAVLLDGTEYLAEEVVEKDWNYYSKGWHRIHGPKMTVQERRVVIRKGGVKTVLYRPSRWPPKKVGGPFRLW